MMLNQFGVFVARHELIELSLNIKFWLFVLNVNVKTNKDWGQSLTVESLSNGEKIALGALEISSIPHLSIIDETKPMKDIVGKYQEEMTELLNELYQFFRASGKNDGRYKDLSYELLWLTQPVSNQPYNADVKLFIIVRAIENDEYNAKELVAHQVGLIKSTLTIQMFSFRDVEYTELSQYIASIDDSSINAIVKEERVENLQNQLLPFCYSYDRLPEDSGDLSKVANVLIEYPNAAVSMQLIPTYFQPGEMAEIDQLTQTLETLNRGIMEHGVGHIGFGLAEKSAENYRYYSERKQSPIFTFNILVYGSLAATSNIARRVFSQVSSGEETSADLKIVDLISSEIRKDTNFYPLPWAANEIILSKERSNQIWTSGKFSGQLYRLPYMISAEEAANFFRLPVGGERISAGFVINSAGKSNKTYFSNVVNAGDITVGKLKTSSKEDTIGFSLQDLAKHMLVLGTPGSGKTTFSVGLLDRLWKEHHIPFLVIEPAKNEYRSLVQSIPDLQVFTPGKNFISPFVFNPFVPPKNVKLETYKSTLKTAFAAGVSMTTPLDKIFEESINNCYSDFRWLDTYTVADKGKIFNISDFIKCFQETFDEIGYTGDAKNIGRAGVVRLKSLVNLFDNYFSIPIEDILQKPTIIELAAIENIDQKALIISLLLLSILAYVNANYVGEGGLKNVILLEEAHVLLDAESNAGEGAANPSKIAQGLVKRMLAEIRSYGVSLIIADQSPRKVTTDVVALTDMKVVFRLVEAEDKQIIADSMNMSEVQVQRLARLRPGEAFFFFNKLEDPEEIVTPDYRLENKISISLDDESIKELSTYWDTRKEKLRPFPECELISYCQHECNYDRRILAKEIARRIYKNNFKPTTKDFEALKYVLGNISKLIKAELNDEEFSPELVSCVKCHLWRKLRYETNIPITNKQIENSLRK